MYLRLSNSLHSILAFVLCSKMKQYWLKFHASGQRWIRVELCGMVQPITHNLVKMETRYYMVWFSQSQRLCSKWQIKMAAPTKPHALTIIFANSEGIWNNYSDIQQKIMQVRFIILLCTQGYNSLVDPIRQHNVWRKTCQAESKFLAHRDCGKFIWQNPLQCSYFYNTQFNYWFGPLWNNIVLVLSVLST